MNSKTYKSFAFQFQPLEHRSLTNEKYDNIETMMLSERPFWMHFENPSKNLRQQLIKKLNIPKAVRNILFAEEARPRCTQIDNTLVLVMQGIQPSCIEAHTEIPSVRCWLTPQGLLTITTDKLQATDEIQVDVETLKEADPIKCFALLLEYIIYYIEETTYELDEKLNKIETELSANTQTTMDITTIRQNIVRLRRYLFPQRDALRLLSRRIVPFSRKAVNNYKELNDNMLRQVETMEMLRERAGIIQDNLTNQIGEISNRRMYLLTVIMLIFTPAFFVMGLFSMYMPIPGMNSKLTWWYVTAFIVFGSVSLLALFKKKNWL